MKNEVSLLPTSGRNVITLPTVTFNIYSRYECYSFYFIIPTDGRIFIVVYFVSCVHCHSYIPVCTYQRN